MFPIQYTSDKFPLTEENFYSYVSICQNLEGTQKTDFAHLLNLSLSPSILKEFLSNENPLIQSYLKDRYAALYTIQRSLEEDFADMLYINLEDVEAFEEFSNEEYIICQKSIRSIRLSCSINWNVATEADDLDMTEAMEFIRYNYELALLSDIKYIRSMALLLHKEEGVLDRKFRGFND